VPLDVLHAQTARVGHPAIEVPVPIFEDEIKILERFTVDHDLA
jgi:hypothetical protein